jgi:guanylate kinase
MAQQNEITYRPNAEVAARLSEKTLVMIVGPVAVGKTFVMRRVREQDPTFSSVSVFTTREGRVSDEPGLFRLYPHTDVGVSELLDLIDKGEVVQYIVHPTTGRMYGTTLDDYQNQINMLPTLSGVVSSLKRLPFKSTVTIGLASQPAMWTQRLNLRYPNDKDPEKLQRIYEAISSLSWLTSTQNINWVDDTTPGAEDAAQQIIHIVKANNLGNPHTKAYAEQMLGQAKKWVEQW